MLKSHPDGEMALPPLVPLPLPPSLKPFTGKPQQVPKPLLGLQTGPTSNLLPLSCKEAWFREEISNEILYRRLDVGLDNELHMASGRAGQGRAGQGGRGGAGQGGAVRGGAGRGRARQGREDPTHSTLIAI